ncbi:MAG: hypothetical protein ACUVWX_13545 [Kiritimatiellia bacterium]
MSKPTTPLAIAFLGLVTGCAQQERIEQLAQRNVELEQRVTALEQENKLFKAELESLRARREAALGKATEEFFSQKLAELLAPRAENVLANRVESLIQRAVEEKLSSQVELKALLEQIAEQQGDERRRTPDRGPDRQAWQQRVQVSREEWRKRRMDTLAQELGLSETQKEQLIAAEAQTGEAARAIVNQMRGQGLSALTNLASVVQDLSARHDEAVRKILTEEQLQAYKNRPDNLLAFLSRMFQVAHPPPLPPGQP